MRVLIVSRGIPTNKYPLNGIFEIQQAKALATIGVDVYYFAIDLRSIRRIRKWGIEKSDLDGINMYVISLPIGAIPLSWLCKIGGWTLLFLFAKVFRNRSTYPDIIHAHFTELGCMSAFLADRCNIPLVITEHSSMMNRPNIDTNLLKCAKIGYHQAQTVIAVSNSLKDNILSNTGVEAKVIANMINLETFSKAKKIEHSGFHIVSTGSLIPGKRFANLIKAFADVSPNHDDIYLHIIGDGYMRDELNMLVTNLGVRNKVLFHGYKNAPGMTAIYEQSDCFALVSSSETFGVVYVEAMAAGLPVIATRCGGPEDFVNESNGLLVDVDSHEQLCNAIIKMYLERTRYSADDIKQYVVKRFSPNVIANQLLGEYNKILRDK